MPTDVRVEIEVPRDRAEVAAYMFDPRNDAAWTTGVIAVNPLTRAAFTSARASSAR